MSFGCVVEPRSEHLILCGGAQSRHAGRALELDIDAAPTSDAKINLRIDHITKEMVADVPDRLVDLLQIACYVFCADQFTSRGPRSMQAMGAKWRRRFRFVVPVAEARFWKRTDVQSSLVDVLGFLSDDHYEFDFVPGKRKPALAPYLDFQADGAPAGFSPDSVILFSGGLDSLAGAADALSEGERVALVSHRSSPMVQSRQTELASALRDRAGPKRLFDVGLKANKGHHEARDFTQRSRSFFFAAIGFVVARLFGRQELRFFENGIVSLNLPVSEHVLGSRATRTTHPKVLAGFSQLFSLIADRQFRVHNPFFWLTKTEVLEKLRAAGYADLVATSFSCTRVREATKTGKHCGLCSQCVDRRFGVLAAGLDQYEPSNRYAVDLLYDERSPGPDLTFAEGFVLTASKFATMSEAAFLSRYGQIYRALPFLDGKADQNAARLHQMHIRHGAAVLRVINDATSLRTVLPQALDLPEHSLLALTHAAVAKQLVDVQEIEPSASLRARLAPVQTIERPLRFAMDEATQRVLFPSGVMLHGASYRLIQHLRTSFEDDRRRNVRPEEHAYTDVHEIAARLRITDATVRQNVSRLRRSLEKQFESAGVSISPDDVIQSNAWHGYRLNPYLAPTPGAHLDESPSDGPRHDSSGPCHTSPSGS